MIEFLAGLSVATICWPLVKMVEARLRRRRYDTYEITETTAFSKHRHASLREFSITERGRTTPWLVYDPVVYFIEDRARKAK